LALRAIFAANETGPNVPEKARFSIWNNLVQVSVNA
jgi:hypothetical protein